MTMSDKEFPSPGYVVLEDGSHFPVPALETDEYYSPQHQVSWYGVESLNRERANWLASVADAYGYLVCNPSIARKKIPMIRRAMEKRNEAQ